ncbi:hypothetical protein FDECE_12262 [Fusarium decemcellulare]|nr:hypothetical protein FDECE_12262 [Fusarium decemcellulare]
MASNNTLFMTPEESERIRTTVQDQMRKRKEQTGQPRESIDPRSLIEQATSVSLMQDLSSAAFGLGAPKKSKETMVAYAIGCPYLPCTAKIQDLEPMKLSELRMERHHRGRMLSLLRVSPVAQLEASSWAVVQGESPDDVERIEIFMHTSKHGRDILEMGSEFLVKEPYYTLNSQGERTIRVDHPSDLVVVSLSEDPESWRRRNQNGVNGVDKPPETCKEMGNAALQKKDFARAHTYYTQGLRSISKDGTNTTLTQDLYRNRSHVNLVLQRYDEAKADALASLTRGKDDEEKSLDAKAYYRAGLAAYALGDYLDAKGHFEQQATLSPDNQYAKLNLRRINARLQEKITGDYNMAKVVSSLPKNNGRPDVASFDGPTEVKSSPGAGRGLFATRDIKPNEIVLCERSFCLAWSYESEAFSSLTCDVRDDAAIRVFPAGLHKAVVQKLLNNPSQAEKVLDLFGDYEGLGKKLIGQDGTPIIDSFQIHDIIQRNAYGPGQQTEDEDVSNASTGLWIRAAYVNHSCAANAKKDFVGDLLILRATTHIAKGEEITQSYDESSDYDVRTQNIQRTWGFKCQCKLCVAEEADGPEVRRRRRELEENVKAFVERENPSGASKIMVNKAKRIRQALNGAYDEKRFKGLPRRALLGIDHWLQVANNR